MPKTAWITGAAGILLLAGLPIVGCWLRRSPQPCCALDGVRLEAVFRVRVQDHEGHSHEFCSVRCAELWLQRQPAPPRAIYVTDEATGQEIDAASAYYVRSQVVTAAPTGNRVHVFRRRSDAERHASVFGGMLLGSSERPFGDVR
jgi:hypothetical protein